MPEAKENRPTSAFGGAGLKRTIDSLLEEIRELYLEDEIPWVVGYSGGKDSTAALSLVWTAVAQLDPDRRHKPIHVITTDTLVEQPVVSAWVKKSIERMKTEAESKGMPIQPQLLSPILKDRYWVNLIGRGYPAPRHKFRWCTERLKINPSNDFIRNVVEQNGEAILVLGTRKAESAKRSNVMTQLEDRRLRGRLSPNASLPNSLVFSPIEDWSNDDVWMFLMQVPNPWGYGNKDLLTMYKGATADGECPLVVDTSTPSCGDSRFGCWVCTLVDKDRSMEAMIQNDQEKEWMLPLLELRNELDVDKHDRDERKRRRDFRRMSGRVQLFHDAPIHGPYKQWYREELLRRVLGAQQWIRENGPEDVRDIELITIDELHEIRRIWVDDKHEIEDMAPVIYEEVTGQEFPGRMDDKRRIGAEEMRLLREVCGEDDLHFEMLRSMLDVERRHRTMARRAGLYRALEKCIERAFYTDEEDAVDRARRRRDQLQAAREGEVEKVRQAARADEADVLGVRVTEPQQLEKAPVAAEAPQGK